MGWDRLCDAWVLGYIVGIRALNDQQQPQPLLKQITLSFMVVWPLGISNSAAQRFLLDSFLFLFVAHVIWHGDFPMCITDLTFWTIWDFVVIWILA